MLSCQKKTKDNGDNSKLYLHNDKSRKALVGFNVKLEKITNVNSCYQLQFENFVTFSQIQNNPHK